MKSKRNPFRIFATTTLVMAFSAASTVHAATIPWDGSDSTAWATGTNWTGDIAPANNLTTDVALFNLETYTNQPDAGTTSVAGIEIGDGATTTGALTLSGTSLTLGSSGISMLANAGAATISAPVTLGSFQTWTNNSANALTAGTISRTAGSGTTLKFAGTGAFAASNTDTNGMIGGWAVVSTGATALGWAHNDGSTITAATTATLGTSFSGDQSTTNWTNTDGNTTLTAATQVNSYVGASDITISGLLTVNSGGMILGNNGSKWIQNGTGGQITSGLASGELFVHTPNTGATDMRIRVPLVNNGATPMVLVKDGAGRLDLEAVNTYSGATILNQGNLYLRTNTALGSSSGMIVNGNTGFAISTNVTFSGPITGSGTLNNGFTTGNASLSFDGNLSGFTGTFAHTTSNGNNNFNLGGGTAASMDASQAKMVLSGSTTQARNVNINGMGDPVFKLGDLSGSGGKINANNGTTLQVGALGLDSTFAGNISSTGGLEKIGAGSLTLTASNAYAGATTVSNGTLQIGNSFTGSIAAASGVTVGASGALVLNLPAAATFPNAITNNGAVSTASGNDLTLSGAIEGAGSISKADSGTLTLSGSGGFSGIANVSAGSLKVNGFNGSAAVTLGAATLSGSGSVGAVTVNDAGAVISNGNGNTDDLEAASLAFSTGATLNLNKFNDTGTPALVVAGNLTTTSGITVNLSTAPVWATGTYNLISYDSFTGSVSHLIKGTIPGLGGRQLATLGSTGPTAGYITLTIDGTSPYWTGANDNTWTTSVMLPTKNWKLLASDAPTDFLANDQVLFNDNATGSTTVNISSADVLVAGVTFENDSLDYTISSAGGHGIADFSAPAPLVKNGAATVTLTTTNSYTGVTSINAGTLQLGDGTTDGDIATSSNIVNDATLVFNRVGGTFTYSNVISGAGAVIKDGAGTQILDGSNTYSGNTTINAGILQMGSGGTTGSLGTSWITNNASLVFNRSNAVVQGTDFGFIDGTGTVTHAGSDSLTLSSANGYTGGTTVSAGTLRLGNNSAAGSGTITLAGGTTLTNIANGIVTANAIEVTAASTLLIGSGGSGFNWDLTGNLTGSGDLTYSPAGFAASLTLTGDNSAYTGTFTQSNVANNALNLNSTSAGSAAAAWVFNNTWTASSRTRLNLDGTIHFGSLAGSAVGIVNGSGTATLSVGALNTDTTFSGTLVSGTGVIALTKVGAGTLTLTGTNTYTGDTTVVAGILAVDGDAIANANKLVINGGKVDPMGGSEVVNTLYFGATQQAAGTWGATGSGADHIDDIHFTGTGVVSVTTAPVAGYSTWADLYAPGQTMDQDHDGDGVDNGVEYFMGQTGSTFTTNPAPASGTVTWTMGATYTGAYGIDYEVQTSTDLVNWTPAPIGTVDNTVTVTAGTSVVFDMPTGGTLFVRLVVRN